MKSSGIKTSTVLASFLLAACLSMRAEVLEHESKSDAKLLLSNP